MATKPRYRKQQKCDDCGPTAVLNALRWAGHNQCIKEIGKKVKYEGGVYMPDMQTGIKHVGKGIFRSRRVYNPKFEDIQNHLSTGGSIIYRYRYWSWRCLYDVGHLVFIHGMSKSGNTFYVVNDSESSPTVKGFRKHRFIARFVEHDYRTANIAWFLRKKDANRQRKIENPY